MTNDTNNIFTERSIPTQGVFTADREVGTAFYNCTPGQNLTWTTGMFFDDINDTVKTRFGDHQGYRLSGRVTCLPYYDEPSNGRYLIHTGVGVLYTDDFDWIHPVTSSQTVFGATESDLIAMRFDFNW